MKVTKQQVIEKFAGRLPQLIWDNVFLPDGADGMAGGSIPHAFKYQRTQSGRLSNREPMDFGRVEVEGYSHRMINIAGKGCFFWVREDVAPSDPAQTPSLQVVAWSEELDFGKKVA